MTWKKKLRRYRGWLAFLALALIAGTVWYVVARSGEQTAETTYTTETVSTGTLSVTVTGTGNLELAEQLEVYPSASGTVESVKVKKGARVKMGEVLYTLEASDAEAATAKALASYRQAQSQVAQAETAVTRAKSALSSLQSRTSDASGTASAADLAAAKSEVTSAQANLASAKASVTTAKLVYQDAKGAEDDLSVTAPADGVAWSVDIASGDSVSAGSGSSSGSAAGSDAAASATGGGGSTATTSSSSSSAPVVIAPDKPLVVTLAINESDLAAIEVDQKADLEFDALPDLAMTGKVTAIANTGTVSSGVVTFDVTIALDVTNESLRPGMSASAAIVTEVAQNAVLVSNSAVKTDSEGDYVEVMNETDTAPTRVTVEIGLSNDTRSQVLSGLSAGDIVVTATSDASESEDSGQSSGGGMSGGLLGGGMPGGGSGMPSGGAPSGVPGGPGQ